jgi:hypothetical protein
MILLVQYINVHNFEICHPEVQHHLHYQEENNLHIPAFVYLVLWSTHYKKTRKYMNEHTTNPGGHRMCLWRTEVNVEHNNCDTDTVTQFILLFIHMITTESNIFQS